MSSGGWACMQAFYTFYICFIFMHLHCRRNSNMFFTSNIYTYIAVDMWCQVAVELAWECRLFYALHTYLFVHFRHGRYYRANSWRCLRAKHQKKGTRCSQGQTCRLTLCGSTKLRFPQHQEPASHPWLHPVLCLLAHGNPAEASRLPGSNTTGTPPSSPSLPYHDCFADRKSVV